MRSWWTWPAAGYILLVTALAAAEQVTRDGRLYLAALVSALPFGLGAIVGVYVAYGLLGQVVGLVSSGLTGDQLDHRTFLVTAPINVVLFAAAAGGNVLLARHVIHARARRART